jgi:AcrR family transcriptional regulator
MSTRRPLNRDRILQQAVELADAHGVEALSMRKLGEALGYEAMSLYRHVSNKSDLLGGMLDLVLAEWEPPAVAGAWDAAIRDSAVSVHAALRRHRWAAQLLLVPPGIRLGRVEYMNALLRRLREAGFDADTAYHAYHVLDGHIFGFTLWESNYDVPAAELQRQAEAFMRDIPFERYPDLLEHRDRHLVEGPHREVSAFEFGLDLILDGLRRTRLSA